MATEQPNIIISVCHDLGRHLNCYGIETVNSPNIDRFAADGVRFDRAFCAAPQCSPSRAALFTGRFPHANGVMGLTHATHAWDMNSDERHLAQMLKDAGYVTALCGIQHERRKPDDTGYDAYDPKSRGKAEVVAGAAAQRIAEFADGDQPFFLQLGFGEPHRTRFDYNVAPDASKGVAVPPYLLDEPSAREDFAYFQGSIRAMDDAWGRVLQAVETAGIADNTIVVFTTDHGIPYPRAKCAVYDPGLEIAQIVRWPRGGWAGGRHVDAMVSNVDVLPTLLECAGIEKPGNLHGESFAHFASGEGGTRRDHVFGEMTYHDYFDPRRCIRTNTHKLIVNFTKAPHFMDPSQQWRPKTITTFPEDPTRGPREPVELYDLQDDPLEHHDLAQQPEHAETRKALLGTLHEWMVETGDPLLTGFPVTPMYGWAMQALQTGEFVGPN